MADLPTARASDVERDNVVALLRDHCVAGRITLDEFTDRMGRALEARTSDDLESAMENLPETASRQTPDESRRGRRWVVAFMSGSEVKGRWRAGRNTTAIAIMGGCKLDLRRAEIADGEIRVAAWALWGAIDIILPEGIDVEVSGFSFMGGRSVKMRDVPVVPGSPVVRVRAFPIMGGVSIRTKPVGASSRQQLSGPTDDPDDLESSGVDALVRAVEHSSEPDVRQTQGAGEDLRRRSSRHPSAGPALTIFEALSPEGSHGAPDETTPRHTDASGRPEITEDGTVTILFSDISDFSGMTERLGDRRVHELLSRHREAVCDLASRNGGRMVKAQGDGFMLAFAGVARALRCAAAIQQDLELTARHDSGSALHAHMGVHTGEALMEGEDYVGHTVIVAYRLAEAAAPDEILVSSVSQQLVARSAEFTFSPERGIPLKGLSDVQHAAPFEWSGGG